MFRAKMASSRFGQFIHFFRPVYTVILEYIWYTYLKFRARIRYAPIVSDNGFGVVFITSYPKRFSSLFIVLDGLSRGTLKPKRTILFLTKEEIKDFGGNLPPVIRRLERRGVEVLILENNYRVYNKLPVFLEKDYLAEIDAVTPIADDPIITIDDDKLPPDFMIERFQASYEDNKGVVLNFLMQEMRFSLKDDGQQEVKLGRIYDDSPRMMALINGLGGVLYPKNALQSIRARKLDFLQYSPTNDDVWFRFCNIADGIYCKQVLKTPIRFRQVPFTHHLGIWNINFSRGTDGAIVNNKYIIASYNHFRLTQLTED